MYEILTRECLFGWCVSAAVLLIEHAVCRPRSIPFWRRYVLGILALLCGAYSYEYVGGRPATATIFAIISTSGALIMALYRLSDRYAADLSAAREVGKIEGRAVEASRRARSARRPGPRSDG